MRRIGFLALIAAATLCFNTANHAWSANCEPTDGVNRPSIEELVGPLEEKTPQQANTDQEKLEQQRRDKQVREARQVAIDRITEKLQTSLEDPNLWLTRARLRMEIDQREGAISDLTQAMKLKGNSAELLAERGHLYYQLNQFDKAEADLNEAVRMSPDNEEIVYARGKLYIDQWKTQPAYDDFTKVIAIAPRHKMARFNRGYLLMGVKGTYGNYRQALEDLSTAVEIDPDWVQARYHYVRVLHALDKHEEVIRHASYVLSQDPDSDCMYRYRSAAYRALNKFDLALKDATKYMEFEPRDQSRIGLRAELYSKMGEHEKAIEEWNAYLKIMPDNLAAYYHLVDSYKALKQYDNAIGAYDKLVELEPKNSDWPRFRGMLKSDLGDYQGALADMTTSIDMGGINYSNLANIYTEMGEYAKAWADGVQQNFATKAFVGKTESYQQELIEEEKVLADHVDRQLELRHSGTKLTRKNSFFQHYKHPAFGKLWLRGLTALVTSSDAQKQETGVQAFREFVDNLKECPIPPEETQAAIGALTQFASGRHPEPLKKEARVLSRVLGVLQVANDPKTEAWQPGSLDFETFTVPKDRQGRSGEYRRANIEWIEAKVDKHYRFRHIRSTPQFVEMYSLERGLWVRLEADQAKWSWDRQNWTLIGKGEITKR